jgi:hypothetical protein
MAWRITADQLRQVVETDADLDVTVFVNTANVLASKLAVVDASGLGGVGGAGLLDSDLLTQIELMLRDQAYTSKSTGGASGSFQVGSGNGLAETMYGRQALALDITGWLARINRGVTAVQMQVAETYPDGNDIDPEAD